jgi:probable rRNA maturation factor
MRATRIFTMIINSQKRVRVAVAPLLRFLRVVEKRLGIQDGAVTVSFVNAAKIAKWNGTYRGKAKATDVLSFPVKDGGLRRKESDTSKATARAKRFFVVGDSEVAGKSPHANAACGAPKTIGYLGDIAICPEVARRNARESNRAMGAELRILILHGVLHLLGHDHETDTGQMERRERKLRAELGLA